MRKEKKIQKNTLKFKETKNPQAAEETWGLDFLYGFASEPLFSPRSVAMCCHFSAKRGSSRRGAAQG